MTSNLELVSTSGPRERIVYLLSTPTVDALPGAIDLPEFVSFILLLAWDASNAPDEQITALSRALIAKDIAELVCWGPDCARVEDLFREQAMAHALYNFGNLILSTSHNEQTLEQALWSWLFLADPGGCSFMVAAVVANSERADCVRRYLADLPSLVAEFGALIPPNSCED